MGQLLARLQNLISIQKAATISVPGILLALGISLFYFAGRLVPAEPLTPPGGIESTRIRECDALRTRKRNGSGSEGQLRDVDLRELHNRQVLIEVCVAKLRGQIRDREGQLARTEDNVKEEQKLYEAALARARDYTLKGIDLADRYYVIGSMALERADGLRSTAKTLSNSNAEQDGLITEFDAERKLIVERIRRGEQDEAFAGFINNVIDRLGYILGFGLVLGWIFDPIAKALQPFLLNDWRIIRLNRKYEGTGNWVPTSRTRTSEDNPNYALGRGWITTTDLNELQERYAYSSQFGLSLIVPLIVLLLAGGHYLDVRFVQPAAAANSDANPAGRR
ncbi:MAG TPA: hypothetical protein VGQ37_04940 [Vicinamibacterales bacterium]|jgi:hypothetical protein|nr:hypothetical protein [Vicinamibacterales bacterium]